MLGVGTRLGCLRSPTKKWLSSDADTGLLHTKQGMLIDRSRRLLFFFGREMRIHLSRERTFVRRGGEDPHCKGTRRALSPHANRIGGFAAGEGRELRISILRNESSAAEAVWRKLCDALLEGSVCWALATAMIVCRLPLVPPALSDRLSGEPRSHERATCLMASPTLFNDMVP